MTRLTRITAVFAVAVFVMVPAAFAWTPPAALVGTWTGHSEVFGTFKKDSYPSKNPADWPMIRLTVLPDGGVVGTVGGARLEDCRMAKNRTWLGRALNMRSDFIVTGGQMVGAIAEGDTVSRRSFTLPCNMVDGELRGGIMQTFRFKYPYPLIPRLHLKKETADSPIN